jgi:hypothetical protein
MSSVSVSAVSSVDIVRSPISLKFFKISLTISSLPEQMFGIAGNDKAIEVTEWGECTVLLCYRV